MFLDTLFALGLLLTTATQLRLPGLPLGPDGACLAVWSGLTIVRLLTGNGVLRTRALLEVLAFWAAFVCALSIGTLVGLASGEPYDLAWFMHDVFAYALLLVVTSCSLAGADAGLRLQRTAWVLAISSSAALAFQVAVGFGLARFSLFEPWFWERFRGWSANPNQLAFACGALALLAVHLAETAERPSGRLLALACLPMPLIVGRMTGSDTFLLMLAAAVPIFLTLKVWSWASQPQTGEARRTAAVLVAFALPLMIISILPLTLTGSADSAHAALALSKGGGKEVAQEADLRFMLWRQAIGRGIETAGFGLGPGPHLKIPSEIVLARESTGDSPGQTVHPQQSGAMNFEAHNTPLDLLTQGGVVAVLAFLWLQITGVLRAWRAHLAGLATLLCGVLLFGMTNLIVRLPLFWFVVALCLVAESHPRTGDIAAAPNPLGRR
jgi:hypothetical protein